MALMENLLARRAQPPYQPESETEQITLLAGCLMLMQYKVRDGRTIFGVPGTNPLNKRELADLSRRCMGLPNAGGPSAPSRTIIVHKQPAKIGRGLHALSLLRGEAGRMRLRDVWETDI
jgi:hypothetical protein